MVFSMCFLSRSVSSAVSTCKEKFGVSPTRPKSRVIVFSTENPHSMKTRRADARGRSQGVPQEDP
jgi:hypothetical protein